MLSTIRDTSIEIKIFIQTRRESSKQSFQYIRREREVRKSKVVETIYLGFNFLKKRSEFLIVATTRALVANIDNAAVYKV